jgi:hypothetical protein
MRALLECVWPASLDTAKHPFRSWTWTAAMSIICERAGADLDRTRRLGGARFEQAVRREILRRGGQKPSLRRRWTRRRTRSTTRSGILAAVAAATSLRATNYRTCRGAGGATSRRR